MAAALRWRLPAPGKGNRDDPLRTLIAGRAVLVITVLAIMSAATGAVALASSTGTLNAPPAVADQEQGMVAGALFQDPPEANAVAGASGPLTIVLDAHDTEFDLAGGNADVRLVNHLPRAANVHFHGLHIDPASHSDDDFLCIAPGDTYTYHLVIPADHPQGTYWYQSRVIGSACPGGVSGQYPDNTLVKLDVDGTR